jgi:hypothetical protein
MTTLHYTSSRSANEVLGSVRLPSIELAHLIQTPQSKPVSAAAIMARNGRKIRYAVVGLGYISQVAVLPAFEHASSNSTLTALVSGDPKKLKILSRKYCVKHAYSYEQYADCLASGEVDAVYIALPNHMHRAYTEAAARAGIHILCEKPMALEEVDCEAMIAEAERAGVKLMIAYRLHFERGNSPWMAVLTNSRAGLPARPGGTPLFADNFSPCLQPDDLWCVPTQVGAIDKGNLRRG